MDAQTLFQDAERQLLVQSIQQAELQTSGEIRVFVENHCLGDISPVQRALEVFRELKMDQTAERNGVIFYLAVVDKRFAVLGDEGIHHKVPDDFWDTIRDEMRGQFKSGNFLSGLQLGIEKAGEKLRTFFPRQPDDVNELPDDIIIRPN